MKKLSELELKNKKYIIFDMDGTLIDSIGVWNRTDQVLIEKYGNKHIEISDIQIERDQFLHDNKGSNIYIAFCEYLIKKYKLSVKDAKKLLELRWQISSEILKNEMDYKPNAVELVLKLKYLGYTLILATMTTQVQLDIYSKENKRMYNQLNLEKTFDLITTQADVINKKPDPEIYNMIIKHYDAKEEECLIFEDSYTGVLAAHNAGIEVICVYDKYADVNRNEINAIADYSINNFKEFIDYINNYF